MPRKRTTPKIFARARELHRNLTPAEARLWSHLRAGVVEKRGKLGMMKLKPCEPTWRAPTNSS